MFRTVLYVVLYVLCTIPLNLCAEPLRFAFGFLMYVNRTYHALKGFLFPLVSARAGVGGDSRTWVSAVEVLRLCNSVFFSPTTDSAMPHAPHTYESQVQIPSVAAVLLPPLLEDLKT